ncbi:MAG: alpha/beta fold hydrolase [Rhodocyclaceae bacterium]|nr:alpha/beta fold hydrolase [Rhodocyclaceae bacterium]
MNSLGSCFGSTGPASPDPATGEPYRLDFPVLTLEDVAAAGRLLLGHLGIDVLHTLVGPSMGGMTSLAYAAQFPGKARRLLLVSCSARALPYAIALRSLQREMILRDPGFADGRYDAAAGPLAGMRLARKLGMITYRSAGEWEQRFGRERIPEERQGGDGFAPDFEVESYLEAHAQKFAGQFDPACYLAPVARQRSLRPRRARRLGRRRPRPPWRRERPGHRRARAMSCTRSTSSGNWPRAWRRAARRWYWRSCPPSRATTPSWWTWTASGP